jgi:hypothetical protein
MISIVIVIAAISIAKRRVRMTFIVCFVLWMLVLGILYLPVAVFDLRNGFWVGLTYIYGICTAMVSPVLTFLILAAYIAVWLGAKDIKPDIDENNIIEPEEE